MLVILVFLIEKHNHGFGCGRAFIKQGSIGQRKASQITDHGLEIQQTFQTALRNFSLVGRVLSIPSRIFENISQNNDRSNRIIITLTDIILENQVPGSNFMYQFEVFSFTNRFSNV